MAKKRGTSGLSLVVAVDKPYGMSSHDVVNRCRRIFNERRVGHCGTLDPAATGALVVCVGPATRLDAYLVDHDKHYRVRVVFGIGTDTDDAEGQVIRRSTVPEELHDAAFADAWCRRLVGPQRQMPPVYSAIKMNGKKACDEARAGRVVELTPRDIEVYSARFAGLGEGPEDTVWWDVDFHVSKGTYIRSLARDMGQALACPAHVGALRRTRLGCVDIDDCISLEVLEQQGTAAAVDVVRLLGLRFAFIDDALMARVSNGNVLRTRDVQLFEYCRPGLGNDCACTSGVVKSCAELADGEVISLVHDGALVALYAYDAEKHVLKSSCGFQVGVTRGSNL